MARFGRFLVEPLTIQFAVTLLAIGSVACGEPKPASHQLVMASSGSSATPAASKAPASVQDAVGAIRSSSCDLLRVQLDSGLDPNANWKVSLSSTEMPLLVLASDSPASRSSAECVGVLLDHHALVDSPVNGGPWSGETALIKASGRGNLPVVLRLLSGGANANYVVRANGHTPLMSAAGYPDVADALLKAGGDVNARDAFGRTPIAFAAMGGCTTAFNFFRSRGSDPSLTDSHGKSADDYLQNFPKNGVRLGVCGPK